MSLDRFLRQVAKSVRPGNGAAINPADLPKEQHPLDDTRAAAIVEDIVSGLREVIRRHGVTYAEYRCFNF
jgi:hypothetical protein